MIKRIRNAIAGAYHFIWAHVFQRPEPWTPQLCRMEEAWSGMFWFLLDVMVVTLWELLKNDGYWESVMVLSGYAFILWLKDHLIDYIQEHPKNTPH